MQQESVNTALIKRLLKYSEKKQISKEQTAKMTNKIVEQIDNGQLSIPDPQADYDNYINHGTKEEALRNIYESEDYYNYERDIRIMKGMTISQIQSYVPKKRQERKKVIKQEEDIKHKKSAEEIKRQFLAKVKKWELQRDKIIRKKREIQMKKKSLEMSSEQKQKKENDEINAFLKLQKQKIIQGKLKQMQQRKAKRKQIIQQAPMKKSESVPKYIEAQQRFKNEQLKRQLQKRIILKNRKQQLQMKMQEIKQHERLYIQRIKQRLNMKSQNNNNKMNNSNDSISKSIDSFNIHKKDPVQMKKIQEKIRRMKQIENKIRLMPLKIDKQKQKQIQILGDKLKNKQKYNFLSQKALSDELIYEEFKDFDINIDKRQLGNQYFEEMKSVNKKNGQRKVSSQKVLPVSKPQYKDYIKQIRQKRKSILNPDQFDSMAKKASKFKDKTVAKNFLLAKSQQFQEKAMQKIYELKKVDNYHDAVKKQEEIDKNYMKAIQAKLALVKVQ